MQALIKPLWSEWFDGRCSIAALPYYCIQDCTRSGPADNAVEYWVKHLNLEAPPWLLRQYLKGCGAYNSAELCDHQANLRRLLWLWAFGCKEGDKFMYLGL
jgi:hypothetical protein